MLAFGDSLLFLALPYGFIVLGLVLTVRYLKVIDLTFASSFVLGPAIMAQLASRGLPLGVSLSAALTATLILVAFSIGLVRVLDMDPLLAGLLASFAGFAVTLMFSQGTVSLSGVWTVFTPLKRLDYGFNLDTLPLHPFEIGAMGFAVLATWLVIDRYLESEQGLAFRAMEDHRSAEVLLPLLGISPASLRVGGLVAGNVLCMLSGLTIAFRENQVTAQRGFDALLTALAAYLLGITLLTAVAPTGQYSGWEALLHHVRRFRPSGAGLAGLILYFAIVDGIARLDVPASVPKLIVVLLIVAVLLLGRGREIIDRTIARGLDHTTLSVETAAFSADHVTVRYSGFPTPNTVLDDICIRAAAGELVHLVGDNGAGKSTLLRYIAGIVPGVGSVVLPSVGSAENWKGDRTRLVGLMMQDASECTCATLSVDEHVALYRTSDRPTLFRSWRSASRDTPSSGRFRVPSGTLPVGKLSGGQRQRLAFASLFLRPDAPRVVLLDEPLANLDEVNALECVDMIAALLRQGHHIILVQHDLASSGHAVSQARSRLKEMISRQVVLGLGPTERQ